MRTGMRLAAGVAVMTALGGCGPKGGPVAPGADCPPAEAEGASGGATATGAGAGAPADGAGTGVEPARGPGRMLGDGVTESLHGFTVRDPYRWLEDKKTAEPWLDAENARTETYFGTATRPGIVKRLEELFAIGSLEGPAVAGGLVFFNRRDGKREQPVFLVRDPTGAERTLIDPNTLDPTGKTALDWYHPSPSGKLLAYGLSKHGDEQSVLHVMEVATGKDLGIAIPNCRAASVGWAKDEASFHYTRYPPKENYDRWVWHHRIGDAPDGTADTYVWGKGRDKTDWPTVDVSRDGKTLVMTVYRGFAAADVYLRDLKTGKMTTVTEKAAALFGGAQLIDGKLYLQTNLDAPKFKVVRIDPKKPGPPARWTVLVPEGDWPIEDFNLIGGKMVVTRLERATSRVTVHGLDGKLASEVMLPAAGAVGYPAGEWTGDRVVFGYSSFFTAPSLYTLPLSGILPAESHAEVLAGVESTFDGSPYEVEKVEYRSYDGTKVPMFIVHRKGLVKDGSHPTLLYGYGGFNISLRPSFSRGVLYWLESGGVYAVANLRGGGELGERWHEAGKKSHKVQVFEDFEFAMRFLLEERYTTPERLAIQGGSNGGLLVGAMVTRCPFLFRAAVGSVGLYDMVRYHKFLLGAHWIDEYGSPEEPKELAYLLGYSPYHNVIDGVRYPALFADTAESDSRVHWVHTAKFVARLRDASSGPSPILFFMRREAGHGAGKAKSDLVDDSAKRLSFLLHELRVPAK